MTSGSALARGAWKTLTYTLTPDGVADALPRRRRRSAQKTGVTITPGDIGDGRTTANYIGRSVYTADKLPQGQGARLPDLQPGPVGRPRSATSPPTPTAHPRRRARQPQGRRRMIDAATGDGHPAGRARHRPDHPGPGVRPWCPARRVDPDGPADYTSPRDRDGHRGRRRHPHLDGEGRRDALAGAARALRRPEHRASSTAPTTSTRPPTASPAGAARTSTSGSPRTSSTGSARRSRS